VRPDAVLLGLMVAIAGGALLAYSFSPLVLAPGSTVFATSSFPFKQLPASATFTSSKRGTLTAVDLSLSPNQGLDVIVNATVTCSGSSVGRGSAEYTGARYVRLEISGGGALLQSLPCQVDATASTSGSQKVFWDALYVWGIEDSPGNGGLPPPGGTNTTAKLIYDCDHNGVNDSAILCPPTTAPPSALPAIMRAIGLVLLVVGAVVAVVAVKV